jgi:hypothetical protein
MTSVLDPILKFINPILRHDQLDIENHKQFNFLEMYLMHVGSFLCYNESMI